MYKNEKVIKMENIMKEVQAFLDSMTQEEFDQLLDKYGNDVATPGPLFKSREDFKKKNTKTNSKQVYVSEHLKLKDEISSFNIKIDLIKRGHQNFIGFEIVNSPELCEMV